MRWMKPGPNGRRKSELFVPVGHFYSPVVDPDAVDEDALEARTLADPAEIDMNYPGQIEMLRTLAPHLVTGPDGKAQARRFRAPNDQFSLGDARMLHAFIAAFRPRTLVEVGSGHSSAVILDAMDTLGLDTRCIFIEPNTERLRKLMRPGDLKRARLMEMPVQGVPLSLFDSLAENDILFLDTSHVAKTGSDVLHEIFEILPRLKPGVIVHFHDIFSGFEYPREWAIEENRSWNEAYFLRAYLANNSKFQIVMHANALERRHPEALAEIAPGYRVDGGSLWLRKVG